MQKIFIQNDVNRIVKPLSFLPLHQIQSQGKTSPTGPPKPANKLDNMLGSLQSDLNRLGVQTVAKGVCGACKKPIVGQVMITLNHTQLNFNFYILTCMSHVHTTFLWRIHTNYQAKHNLE